MFNIDWSKYKIIDLSLEIVPPGSEDRPFKVEKSTLADKTYSHKVATHSHVGTHVEASSHFYDDGKDIPDYPLEAFMGRGILLEAAPGPVTREYIESAIGEIIRPGDIVISRNKTMDPGKPSYITPESARWLVEKGIKMYGIDSCSVLGKDIADTREVHDVLMSHDVTIVEFLHNLELIGRREFYFMALPYRVKMDSSWARAVAIEDI